MAKLEINQAPTGAFVAQAWVSFGASFSALLIAAVYLDLDPWVRAFLALGTLYLTTSCFTLAKILRDQHEAGRVTSRIDEAKIERFLADQDVFTTL